MCIETIRTATLELADRLGVPTSRVAVGGRSMGGRMCSMAVAEGLWWPGWFWSAIRCTLLAGPTSSGPPTSPTCTCRASSSRVGGTPPVPRRSCEGETEAIPGTVTLEFADGDDSLRKRNPEVADVVAAWLTALR